MHEENKRSRQNALVSKEITKIATKLVKVREETYI